MGQGPRVKSIRFGQLPGGFGKVAGLSRIDHGHGEAGCGQRGDHGPLVPASGFEYDERGRQGLKPCHEGGNARVIVGDRPAFARGPQGNIALGCGHINTNKVLWGRHNNS
jgi:hypothetical protein